MKITKKDVKAAEGRITALKNKLGEYKERGTAIVESFVGSVETNGAAFAMGLATGKTGGIEFMGAPLELSGGLIVNVAGLAAQWFEMPLGKHLVNVADGMTSGFFYASGLEAGAKWRAKASEDDSKQLPAGATPAAPPP